MDKYKFLWNEVLDLAEKNYDYDTFNEIFSPCIYHKFHNSYINVLTPNEFIKTKLNKFHNNRVNELLSTLTTENIKIKFISDLDIKNQEPIPLEKNLKMTYRNNLRASYNFDNFVVGQSNMFAFRSAMKIADQPGIVANPFYIFGSVGLGKTHLMQSVGNYILDNDINKVVLYVKADQFIEDYSKFCKGDYNDFNAKYHNIDVLLIDDIQVLEIGKKSQLEFFKLFDELYSLNKQIILTSDRPAHELNIMERLTSRFSQGLTVDIQTPNLEHRVNILKRKILETTNTLVDDDVLEYIASKFTNNIRELEGAFTRILYYCTACDMPINLENTQEAIAPLIANIKISNSFNEKNFSRVQDVVASFYNITLDELIGAKRQAKIALARHIAMYILKTNYGLSYKKIGSLFSGRDHSTIISGCEKIENELKINPELKLAIDTILKKIN